MVRECGVKNRLQRSQKTSNTIKTAIRVRAPLSRENLITTFYTSRYADSVHEPSMVTFSQRLASAYANFFAIVVGIIRS